MESLAQHKSTINNFETWQADIPQCGSVAAILYDPGGEQYEYKVTLQNTEDKEDIECHPQRKHKHSGGWIVVEGNSEVWRTVAGSQRCCAPFLELLHLACSLRLKGELLPT